MVALKWQPQFSENYRPLSAAPQFKGAFVPFLQVMEVAQQWDYSILWQLCVTIESGASLGLCSKTVIQKVDRVCHPISGQSILQGKDQYFI